jgi:hypothetical protein
MNESAELHAVTINWGQQYNFESRMFAVNMNTTPDKRDRAHTLIQIRPLVILLDDKSKPSLPILCFSSGRNAFSKKLQAFLFKAFFLRPIYYFSFLRFSI